MAQPRPRLNRYLDWLHQTRGLDFDASTTEGYDRLWRWSCDDLPAFWQSIWDYFEIESPTVHATVVDRQTMPGTRWFPGARVNYAQHMFRHADRAHAAGHPAIVFRNESMQTAGTSEVVGWPELRRRVAAFAARLDAMGVQPGDRVCAFMPNVPQTAVAFLACASLGAVWSVCSADMGPLAVLDRFRQIEPVVLVACDGYVHGGATHDRMGVLRDLLAALPSVRHVVLWNNIGSGDTASLVSSNEKSSKEKSSNEKSPDEPSPRAAHEFDAVIAGDVAFAPRFLPFDHPLWIVYSSGTTGLPKAIVHGHGGVMLESLKAGALHNDVGPSADTGDRYHWYSSTGWIMWNSQMGALLGGTTVCMYDGSPAGPHSAGSAGRNSNGAPANGAPGSGHKGEPDWSTLWRFAAETGVTFFGAGAAFYASCLKAGVEPRAAGELSAIRAVGSTGSPLAIECYEWIWAKLPKVDGRDVWLTPISGGTDFAGAFVSGLRTLPVVAGEMQCRCLGAAVEAWGEPDANGRGRTLIDEVGELVCTKPMPSMPLYLWDDPDGRRLHDSYFDMYPGVWRHGDWIRITPRGGAIIYGRSDATINRHGIRMGTAELYRAVETMPEVLDSLVVDLEYLGRESYMPLFVVLREGDTLDASLTQRLRTSIRTALSARHVPNEIFQVRAVPRTSSGKKMELPVKKLLMGTPADQVFKPGAMADAGAIDWFVAFAARRRATSAAQG